MNINRRKTAILFVSTSLIVSLLFFNFNLPMSASGSSEQIYLDGLPLVPIHMHSNESLVPVHMNSNMTLTPVHVHYIGDPAIDPIYEPVCTPWHELYPEFCMKWHLTSHVDMDGDGKLSPNDQIDMTDPYENVTWYHMDRITWTLLLSNVTDPEDIMYVEYKGSFEPEKDPINDPVCTYWHEVYPNYCNVYHINATSGPLEYCTYILIENVTGGGLITEWHVEEVVTDLILREKIMDPICTWWHEIYPDYCRWHHLTSWEEEVEDPYSGMLSPSDQIDMIDEETGNKTWYHVDRMTIALNVTLEKEPTEWMKIELKTYYFEEMYNALKHPVDTLWHEVYPDYSNLYILTWWDWWEDDNCNGVLDVCDYIWLYNNQTGEEYRYHVEDICYDIILNKKIMDPICTYWYEVAQAPYSLEPPFRLHHLTSWEEPFEDPYPGRLSPGDQIDMTTIEGKRWYHVDRVTLTLNITMSWGETYLFEFKGPFEDLYLVKTKPVCTLWHMVWPYYDIEGYGYHIDEWKDNCNGVLDYCDDVILAGEWGHVNGLYIDLILNEKIIDPECTDWHELYPEFCNWYHVEGWTDNGDNLLSPCDFVDLALLPTGPTEEYHVEYVTITINITDPVEPWWWIVLEYYYEGPVETMYWVKTHPIESWWYEPGLPAELHQIQNWTDNCNGVLDYCDYVMFYDYWYHVEGVAIDMVVAPPPIHDVAVTKVASLKDWVYQGQIDPISVTITNYGDYDEPTVDVYAFYDGTLAAPKQTTSLLVGETKTLTFNWDTTGVPPGFYTVSANATIPIDDVPGNNYLVGNVQEVRERPPPPEDLELYPREVIILGNATCTQWHELHPNKTNYYHLTSWEPGRVLSPHDQIDMYAIDYPPTKIYVSTDFVDPLSPICSEWFEESPTPQWWHLSSWEDNNGDGYLSECDQIDMTNMDTGEVVWFHVQFIDPPTPEPGPRMMHLDVKYFFQVDEVTIDLVIWDENDTLHWLDYECGYWTFDPKNPICTKWNEIKPDSGRCWHLTAWYDFNMNDYIDMGDEIIMTPMHPFSGPSQYCIVKSATISLMLTPKPSPPIVPPPPVGPMYLESEISYDEFDLANPVCTTWHEILPEQGRRWHLSSWEDVYALSPSDQIVLTLKDEFHEPIPGTEAEYHVDKLTVAMNLTSMYTEMEHIVKFEGSLKQFMMYRWKEPWGTQWHEVNPTYCRQWYLADWLDDNLDGILDYCDYILMIDKETGEPEEFHVESLSTDIIVTLKVHDINVTDVTPIKTVVGQGYNDRINVTVANEGHFIETFNVTAYANTTIIGNLTVNNLPPGSQTTLTFVWNTIGFAKGSYTIKAHATPVPPETDTTDNILTDGVVQVVIPGDVNADGTCNMKDIYQLIRHFMCSQGQPCYVANYDINCDGTIDMKDIYVAIRHFGETDC